MLGLFALAGSQRFESGAESLPRAMQTPPRGHRETAENNADLRRREALPLCE
jgi:hypothetical protein